MVEYKVFENNLNTLKFIFAVSAFILLIIVTYKFYDEIKYLNINYDKWFLKNKQAASEIAKKARQYISPEIFNKLKLIFNPPRILSLSVIIFSYFYFCFFIIGIIKDYEFFKIFKIYSLNSELLSIELKSNNIQNNTLIQLKNEEDTLIFSVKKSINDLITYKKNCDLISEVLLFIASLGIIFYLNLGRHFYTLSQIIIKILPKNFVIVIILTLILPCFIFFSYLNFGPLQKDYFSFYHATMISFETLQGNIYDKFAITQYFLEFDYIMFNYFTKYFRINYYYVN